MTFQKSLLSALFILALGLLTSQANAQVTSSCLSSSATPVATGCVGSCGNPGTIVYQVGPLCTSKIVPFCLTTDASNLCPSNGAFAAIYVDGNFVAGGDITAVGSSIGFTAKCGSTIKIIVKTKVVNPNISCVQLGDLHFSLRK